MATYEALFEYNNTAGVERQKLKLVYSLSSISLSGTTASATLTYDLYVARDSYGPTYGKTQTGWIKLNGTTIKTISGTCPEIGTSYVRIASGTQSITYSASTTYTGNLTASYSISNNSKLTGLQLPPTTSGTSFKSVSSTGSLSFTLAKQTSACGAPTQVSASGYVTPSGSFEVSWSGASSGTNNSISSYLVYYRVSSNGAAPTPFIYTGTKEVTSTSTSGSTTIALSSAKRGDKVVCGVVTRGSAGSSYYSGIKTGGSVSVNQLPASPTVSTNTTKVSSSGTEVVFNVTAGSDLDEQNCTLYYATSETGEKTNFTSPLSKTLNAAATYYFYTYDGIEYSSAASISITLNTKPVINNIEVNTISTYTALNSNGVAGYQKGYADTIQPKITANKGGTLKIMVEMSGSNSTTSTTNYDYTYTLPDYDLTTNYNKVILKTYDINTAVVNKFSEETRKSTNIKWRLKFILTDGIDDSDAKYFPTGGYFYTIAHSPSLDASFNRFADSKVPGTIATQIWREVRMKFYNDASTPIVSVTATANNVPLSTTFTTSVSGNYRYVDITLPDNIASKATINITASLTNASSSIIKNVSCTVTETSAPNMNTLIHGANVIYPFTDKGTYQISMAWPFGNYEDINTALTAYNCSTTIDNAIKFVHASDTSGSNLVIKTLIKQNQVTWKKNNNTITATLDGKTAYGWGNELGYNTYAGQKTYYCQLRITNLFGKTYTSEWLSRQFNFDEVAQNLSIQSVQWATSNTSSTTWSNFTTGSNGYAAQEGMYLKFNLNFGLFTKEAITVQLKRKIKDEENISISKTYPIGAEGISYANGQTSASNSISLVYGPVGTISDTEKRVWSFQITNARGTTESAGVEMKVLKQVAPIINFTSCSINQDYVFTYGFTQADTGGGSITNYLYDYDKKTDLTNYLSGPSSGQIWSGTKNSNTTDWEVKSVCVKSVSTVTGLINSTKEYYSNYIIVYKVSPTVAYRKNQLGINTDSPNTEYIIDIRPASGYKKVRLYDGTQNGDSIELDLSKVYDNNNHSCPAMVIKKGTTEYTLFFD